MVLDPFRVGLRNSLRDAEAAEELHHNVVAPP